MTEKLTAEDIRIIKYQCRAGIIIFFILLILGFIFFSLIIDSIFSHITAFALSSKYTIYSLSFILSLLISTLVAFLMAGKYLKDIKNGEKIVKEFTIDRKELKQDTEAGSGTMYIAQDMNVFDKFSIIINQTRFRVNKELFNACTEGDKVLFHIAPKSDFRLYIQLKKDKTLKFS